MHREPSHSAVSKFCQSTWSNCNIITGKTQGLSLFPLLPSNVQNVQQIIVSRSVYNHYTQWYLQNAIVLLICEPYIWSAQTNQLTVLWLQAGNVPRTWPSLRGPIFSRSLWLYLAWQFPVFKDCFMSSAVTPRGILKERKVQSLDIVTSALAVIRESNNEEKGRCVVDFFLWSCHSSLARM